MINEEFDPGEMLNNLIEDISNNEEELSLQDVSHLDNLYNPSISEKFDEHAHSHEKEDLLKIIADLKEKNELSQKTLAEYESKMTKLMEDSISAIENSENLRHSNGVLEMENSKLQKETFRLQSLNNQFLKRLQEDDVQIHKLKQNVGEMEKALRNKKDTGTKSVQKDHKVLESHLSKAMKYMSKFGVTLNKKGHLSSETKSKLLKDFDGVNLTGTIGIQISKEIQKIVKNYPVKSSTKTSYSEISSSTSYQQDSNAPSVTGRMPLTISDPRRSMVMDETGINEEPNEVILPNTGHLDTPEYPTGDEIIDSSSCQSLSESPSSPSIFSQTLSDTDFDADMQIDDETPHTEPAGICERIGVNGHSSQSIITQNPAKPKEGENVISNLKGSPEDISHLSIPESFFLRSFQSQSLRDANPYSNEKILDTKFSRMCDERTSQLNVTTYDPEDQLKIRAENHIDFMLLKNCRVDNLAPNSFEYSNSCPSTRKSSPLDCETEGSEINSSEIEKLQNPLLPSYFHDNTRPNTCLNENLDVIPKAHLSHLIMQASRKRNATRGTKYALRSVPRVRLISLAKNKIQISKKTKWFPFDSALSAIKNYNIQRFGSSAYLKGDRINYFRKIGEENPIKDVFIKLENSSPKDSFNELAVSSLIKTLTDIEIMPDKTTFLYYTFHYLYTLGNSFDNDTIAKFSLHPYEKTVLSALFEVDQMKKPYLNNLMSSAVESLHLLIIRKPRLMFRGVLALGRVFSEICRRENLIHKPVSLAVDLMKRKYGHSTLIVASMVSIWSEPFEVTELMPDEEKCFRSAISFGVHKWKFWKKMTPKPLYSSLYSEFIEAGLKILDKHICPFPNDEVLIEVIEFLFAKIHIECDCRSFIDVENILFSPLIILSAYSEWTWVQKNILENHIIPSLSKYAQEKNETAFAVFCDLYVYIFFYSSKKFDQNALISYYKRETVTEGDKFLRDCAAVSLIRLLVLQWSDVNSKRLGLYDWLEDNTQNPITKSFIDFMTKYYIRDKRAVMLIVKKDF